MEPPLFYFRVTTGLVPFSSEVRSFKVSCSRDGWTRAAASRAEKKSEQEGERGAVSF